MTDERPADQPDEPTPVAGSASNTGSEAGATSGDGGGWANFDPDAPGPGMAGDANGKKILGQLQSMIDSIATQAAPVAKQIGVKAAELTAVAADRAGPLAHRAGDAAADASGKLAQRSRELAEDLRRELAEAGSGGAAEPAATSTPDSGQASATAGDAGSTATAVIDRPADEPPTESTPGPA